MGAWLQKNLEQVRRITISQITFPVLLVAVLILCFGYFIPRTGFFWDDWVQLLNKSLFGPASFGQYFYERPFSGWTHQLFGPWMGVSTLRWQIFTLSLRAGCGVLFWMLFAVIWPEYRRHAMIASLFFMLYPSFTQQLISVAYHQHWLQYLLYLLSLYFMILGVKSGKFGLFYKILAVVFQILQFSITEFFVGVELMRLVLLWVFLTRKNSQSNQPVQIGDKVKKFLVQVWPYLAIFGIYLIWRGFLLQLPEGHQNQATIIRDFLQSPLETMLRLVRLSLEDFVAILLVFWQKVFDLQLENSSQPLIVFSWAASVIGLIGLLIYFLRIKPAVLEQDAVPGSISASWILMGLLGTFLGPLPLWLAGQNILTGLQKDPYHVDRFSLASMMWVGLLFVGAISWLMDRWKPRVIFSAVIFGLLIGFQIRNANEFRWLSIDQQRFYWQLYWRAPALEPQTALITEEIQFPFQGMFATSGAVNLLYSPARQENQSVPYWVYSIKPGLVQKDPLKQKITFRTRHRIFEFSASVPDTLIFLNDAPKGNCLWMLRPEDADYPDFSPLLRSWLPVSNLSRIRSEPEVSQGPSRQMFGTPQEGGWCYFFERADLARQLEDWDTAAALADRAREQGYTPESAGSNSAFEWQPFIEAYGHVGRWSDAAGLVLISAQTDPAYIPFLCGRWQNLVEKTVTNGEQVQAGQTLENALGCRQLQNKSTSK